LQIIRVFHTAFCWLILFFLFIVLEGTAFSSGSQPVIVIEIPAKATVTGPGLRLGDLASIQGATVQELEAIRNISLGAAPPAGQARIFTRNYLMLILKQQSIQREWALKMGEQVEVRIAGVFIGSQDFETALAALLPPKKPGIIKKWLEIGTLPGEIWLGKDDQWRLEPSVIGNWPEVGPVLFKVVLWVNENSSDNHKGQRQRNFNIRGKVRATALLYRAVRDISYHRDLKNTDFELDEKELVNGREVVGEFPEKVRSLKFIKRGEVLRQDDFQPVPLVVKGHPVEVIVKGSGLEIRMTGVAQDDGWLGDEVKVMNSSSKKTFRAKVIGEDRVEVILR
jgi:flagella basal body P-ring formation protein FlgA